MKVNLFNSISASYSQRQPVSVYKSYNGQFDTVCFQGPKVTPNKLFLQKYKNILLNKKLCECNFSKLEGVQKGLKSFEGLSMKQIAFALTDLHSLGMICGCTNHCLHCYANAQPYIKRSSYEDFQQLCNDIKELKHRTGAKPCHHHGAPYIQLGFDVDALDCHLFDKDGRKYDYVDLSKQLYESTGYKSVFDTNGWSTLEKQKVAEEYVEKLVQDDNYKFFEFINLSINPFSPKYVKALSYGYDIEQDHLYSPFKKVSLESDMVEDSTPEGLKKARELYTNYVKKTTNLLLTFKPLLKCENFGMIIRALDDNISNMKGYTVSDFNKTLNCIATELSFRQMFGELTDKELEKYLELLSKISYRVFSSGRMEKFYKTVNNGILEGIEKIDNERVISQERLETIKSLGRLSAGELRFLKLMSPDGRVFLYDNYAVIPTDIQLKTSIDNVAKPFQIKVEDFVIREDMVDII